MEIYENLSLQDLDGEIWKEVCGYDGDYFVSNLGRVKSFKKHNGTNVRILTLHKNNKGYFYVILSKNGKVKYKLIHTLMYENHIEKITEGYVIHHIDENKINNIFENFQVMTDEDHRKLHTEGENNPMFGVKRFGEKSTHHTLTEQKVIKIKIDLDEGILTQKEIGEKFGVNQPAISQIKIGKRWKHIKNIKEK